MNDKTLMDMDTLPQASQAVASAQKEGEGNGHIADNNYVHHMKSMKDLEHQLKRNLMKECQYRPDYKDAYLPSIEEINAAFAENGMRKRVELGTLPGGQDTLTKFEDMFTAAYAVADHVLRIAGPTRASIRATRVVRVRPYPIRDKQRFEAFKLIIQDLLA